MTVIEKLFKGNFDWAIRDLRVDFVELCCPSCCVRTFLIISFLASLWTSVEKI